MMPRMRTNAEMIPANQRFQGGHLTCSLVTLLRHVTLT